jgi:aspartyl-tRNA(Asn)/glutamyl-tRNA(Gln) amidotransferase subunit A
MTNNPLENISLEQYAQDLRSGKFSVEATVSQYLQRIAELNPKLDAITELDSVRALAAAKGIDCLLAAGQDPGPLAGLPILVKDLFHIQGMTITAGSRMDVRDLAPKEEGPFIQALRRAGCVILGKTRTTEFAMGGFNLTHPLPWNPIDMDVKRMTGGSSHGSAVGMAAGLCAFAVGSDTGGSVRQPAAFTGVVGYKSHRHYWPTEGVFPMSPSLDSVGIFTRTAEDAAWVEQHLNFGSTTSNSAPRVSLAGLRLGLPTHHIFDFSDNDTKQTFARAVEKLKQAGVTIVPIEFPEVAEMDAVFGGMVPADVLGFLGHDRFTKAQSVVDPVVWARTEPAFNLKAADYIRTQARYKEIVARVRARMANLDGWISPTTPTAAPPVAGVDTVAKVGDFNRINTSNTRPGNLFDQCGISLPIRGVESGLPIGFQLMCGEGDDKRLLKIACEIEKIL